MHLKHNKLPSKSYCCICSRILCRRLALGAIYTVQMITFLLQVGINKHLLIRIYTPLLLLSRASDGVAAEGFFNPGVHSFLASKLVEEHGWLTLLL